VTSFTDGIGLAVVFGSSTLAVTKRAFTKVENVPLTLHDCAA
jgi:hypothetical protein